MNDDEVAKYWNDNASTWTQLTSAGYDHYRDYLNTPTFLQLLPDIDGLHGIDIGCGDGHNTRLLAKLGARMTGIDIAEKFIESAREKERENSTGTRYVAGSALCLPYGDGVFNFATAIMSLMDISDSQAAVSEAYRVIAPGGFMQLSITHPCFDTPHRRNLRDENRKTYAVEVGDYFKTQNGEIEEWTYGAIPDDDKKKTPKFKIPRFSRTLSQWVNLLIHNGFVIERMEEPRPTEKQVQEMPSLQDAGIVAYFLHIRVRKLPQKTRFCNSSGKKEFDENTT